MIIGDLRVDEADGLVRHIGSVQWEENDREPLDLFFAVDERDAGRIGLSPEPFRIPAAIVALRDGEARITGGRPMCPALHNGLSSSLAWLRRWSEDAVESPILDIPVGCEHPTPGGNGATAAFVSGGIDSSALLAANHAAYEPDHPRRISMGIVVVGIQPHRWSQKAHLKGQIAAARAELSPISSGFGLDIVPVATNVRELNPRVSFWTYEYQGAALAGIGHMFSPTISDLCIASTWEIDYLDRWGSHPLLDPGYGTHSLHVWHELAHIGRLEKTRLVASRPELLTALNVCNKSDSGDSNCGRCEKCLRTMLALEALGILDSASAFKRRTVEPEDLKGIRIMDRGLEGEYLELVEPLRKTGHTDLAEAVWRRVRLSRLLRLDSVNKLRVWGARLLPKAERERLYRRLRVAR